MFIWISPISKANANKKKVTTQMIMQERRYYQDELEAEMDQECSKQGFKTPTAVTYDKKNKSKYQ